MMTNSEAIKQLKERYDIGQKEYLNFAPQYIESLKMAMESLEENTKLKADVEQLKAELEQAIKLPKELDKGTVCYIYANSVYTVSVDNIGKVFKLRGIRNFYGNYQEAEQHLKGKVKE